MHNGEDDDDLEVYENVVPQKLNEFILAHGKHKLPAIPVNPELDENEDDYSDFSDEDDDDDYNNEYDAVEDLDLPPALPIRKSEPALPTPNAHGRGQPAVRGTKAHGKGQPILPTPKVPGGRGSSHQNKQSPGSTHKAEFGGARAVHQNRNTKQQKDERWSYNVSSLPSQQKKKSSTEGRGPLLGEQKGKYENAEIHGRASPETLGSITGTKQHKLPILLPGPGVKSRIKGIYQTSNKHGVSQNFPSRSPTRDGGYGGQSSSTNKTKENVYDTPPTAKGYDIEDDFYVGEHPTELLRQDEIELQLQEKRYFVRTVRGDLNEILADGGGFLVRRSTKKDDSFPLTMCCKQGGQIYKLFIGQRSRGTYAIGAPKPQEEVFKSVDSLIRHHRQNPICTVEGTNIFLRKPPRK